MTYKRLLTAISATFFVFCTDATYATPITLTGNYISVAINDLTGTLGSGSETRLGLKFDPTGTGNFNNNNDFISPDVPYDNFAIHTDQTSSNSSTSITNGLVINNNAPFFPKLIPATSLVDLSSGSSHSALWTGTYTDFDTLQDIFTVTNLYSFDDNSQRINVTTTISALTDLTGLTFLRSVDPDQDENDPLSATDNNTINTRGLTAEGISVNNIVSATGPLTGLTLALFSDSEVEHNTGITFPWSADPSVYLNGVDQSNGQSSDSLIGLAFNIGSLAQGQSIALTYDYALSTTSAIPLPGAAWLFLSGMITGLHALRKRNNI